MSESTTPSKFETKIISAVDGEGVVIVDQGNAESTAATISFGGSSPHGVAFYEVKSKTQEDESDWTHLPERFEQPPHFTYDRLHKGSVTFSVRVVDSITGEHDPNPASISWTVN